MNTFTFIIGSTDDFESMDDLLNYVEMGPFTETKESVSYSFFEYTVPDGAYSKDTVTMIGRGMAFSDGWSMDGSLSFVVEGVV